MEGINRRLQYLATFLVGLSNMTASVTFSWTVPAIPKFYNHETNVHITDDQLSWIVASVSLGLIPGSFMAQYTVDRYGRRATVLGSALPFLIGTIFVAFATNAWMLYVARISWGIGCGVVQTVSAIYAVEVADKKVRGRLSSGNRFMFNFGGFLVLTVGSLASYNTLSYMLFALPISYFIACWFIIPETPYYLLKEGKVDDAKKVLMQLNNYKDEKVLDDRLSEMQLQVLEEMERKGTLKELFTGAQYRKALIVSFGLKASQLMSGSIPIQQYLGGIMIETRSEIPVSVGLITFGIVRLITSMLSTVLVDRIGRRPLLIYSYIMGALILAALGTSFFLDEVVHRTPLYYGYIILIGLILFRIVSILGFETVSFVIPAELFPLNVKSKAMTLINVFASAINFTNVKGYQVVKTLSGLYGVFWFYAAVAIAGAVFSYSVVPETRGKSLRQIQLELRGDNIELVEKINHAKDAVEESTEPTLNKHEEETLLRT